MVENVDILYVFRPPQKNVSIETVFERVNAGIKKHATTQVYTFSPHHSLIWNIFQIIKLKPRIFHITGDIAYVAIFLCFKKVVLTIHDIGHYKNLRGWKKIVYGLLWVQLPAYCSCKITVVSEYTKKDLLNHFKIDQKKVQVVYNPLSDRFIHHPSIFNGQDPTILIVGTAKHKNVENILKAVEGLKCRLVIVGSLSVQIQNMVQQMKIRSRQIEKLEEGELIEEYIKCDLLVFVSKHEGFGMPVIEAQAIGRAVITSKITSLPEVAGPDACFVENPDDFLEIRSKIEKVTVNDSYREHLISTGLANVKRFKSEIIAAKYEEIYKSLLPQ